MMTMTFISNHIIYQRPVALPTDAEVFDFMDSGIKYELITGYIDVLTGERVRVDYPYVFQNIDQLRDKNGHFTLAEAVIAPISKAKTLDFDRRIVIDKMLKEVLDLKGMTAKNYVKVEGGYYHVYNGTLFDENLNFIVDLSEFTPRLLNDLKHIVLRDNINNRQAIIKTNGQVLFDFDFDYISRTVYSGKLFAAKNFEYYILTLATGEKTKIEGPGGIFAGELVHVRDLANRKYTVYNPLGVIYSEEIEEGYTSFSPNLHTYQPVSGVDAILIKTQTDIGGVIKTRYTVTANNPIPTLKSITIGTEVNAPIPMGASVSDAFILKLGNNKVHQPNSGYGTVYFKYTPEEDGSYTLMTPYSVVIQLHSADENFENLVLLTTGVSSLTYSTYDASTNYVLTIAGNGTKYYLVHFTMND
ncbi:MAG: hypothetical protein WCY90_00665 [Bacilli bacterium]